MHDKLLLAALVTGFVLLNVFAFFFMHPMGHMAGCFAAATENADCPQNDLFNDVSFHINAFLRVSTAISETPFMSFLFLALTAIIGLLFITPQTLGASGLVFVHRQNPRFFLSPRISRWFAMRHQRVPAR